MALAEVIATTSNTSSDDNYYGFPVYIISTRAPQKRMIMKEKTISISLILLILTQNGGPTYENPLQKQT